MKGRPLHERLGFAFQGLLTGWRREHSFRAHCFMALMVLVAMIMVRPPPVWWALVAIVVGLVFAFELFNSAMEALIDLLHPGVHPEIKVIKDMLSGAVLTTGIVAVMVGVALLVAQAPIFLRDWGVLR